MRAIRSRRRVSPSGWRALRREAHRFTNRQDGLSATIVLCAMLGILLCLGVTALVASRSGRFPPALQVIDDLRFNADYRRGSTFTAAALAQNGRLWMGTDANGVFAYQTNSGWQGLWQQYTQANTGGGLVSDKVQGLSVDAQRLWIAVGGGLSTADLDAKNWQGVIGSNGFAPFGKGTAPSRARLSPDGRWLAVASADQGVGLYDTTQHDWQPITQENGLLPANAISALEFDPSGNLWIGTQSGLVSIRIGGKAARGPTAIELPDHAVVDLSFGTNQIVALGADGSLFTLRATLGGSSWLPLGKWQQQASTGLPASDAQNIAQNMALAALTKSAIWVVTHTGTLGRYDLATHDWRVQPVANNIQEVRDLVISDEIAYLATDVGLFRVSFNVPDVTKDTLLPVAVRKLAFDGARVWYLNDDAQVGYLDDVRATTVRTGGRFGPDQGPVILADVTSYPGSPGELWVSVPGFGIGAYDITTHGWRSVSNGLPSGIAPKQLLAIGNTPAALVTDTETGKTALYLYSDETWSQISAPEQDITATASTDSGLWYKTVDGALYLTDGTTPDVGYFQGDGPASANSSAAAATANLLWLAQDKALWRYDRSAHTWAEFPQTEPFDPIEQLAASGDKVFVLSGGRLVVLGPDGKARQVLFDAPTPLAAGVKAPGKFVSAAVYQGSVWLVASDGRVFRYKLDDHSLKELSPEGAQIAVLQTTTNGLWAFGGGSLYRFDPQPETWSPVTGLTGTPRRIIPLKAALAVNTDQDTLDWVSESGEVSSQSTTGFAGLQDLTAISQADDGRVWFGSAAHGIGIYQPDLHTWTVDVSVGPVRAMVAVQDGVSVATDQGIVLYPGQSNKSRKELDGDARALTILDGHTWALLAEPDGNALYRRETGGRWTLVRKSSAIPVDINTITAVVRVGNRFVLGTSAGKVLDYNMATGVWRTINETLPIARVDWIGLNGSLSNDGRSATIWLVGPAKDTGDGQLVEIDTRGQVRQRSKPGQKVVTASTGAGRVWYTDASGGVFYLGENSAAPDPLAGVLAPVIPPTSRPTHVPTNTLIPSATPTQPIKTESATTGTSTVTPTATITPTDTRTPTATITLTPTLSIPQQLVAEPVKGLAINQDQFWLVTDKAIYQMRWNGTQLEPVHRVDSTKAVKRLRADDAGLLLAFDDNSAGRVANSTLTTVQGFDATVLYADSDWLWRQSGNSLSVSLSGKGVPVIDGRLGFDVFQTLAGNGKELWIGGKGGASQIDTNGAITLYTQPGAVDSLRTIGASWFVKQGTLFRRFDAKAQTWVDAAPADYAAPITIATTGPIQWQVTDKGIVSDPPNTTNGSRFPFDTITAIGSDSKPEKQIAVRTGLGVWIISDPLTRGEYTAAPKPDQINSFFSGSSQTKLASSDGWNWTLTENRAAGSQSLDVALAGDPAVKRQVDPATGLFADDEVLSITSDPQNVWIGTKAGLWHSDGDSRDQLYAPGHAVSQLRMTDAGLLALLDANKTPQLFDGTAFAPTSPDNTSYVVAKDDVLGTLLEQSASGFSLSGYGDTPRMGYWFDQAQGIGAYQDLLWVATARGLIGYRLGNRSLGAERFEPSARIGMDVGMFIVAPLDPAQPDSQPVLWALSTTGQITAAFVNDEWKSMPYASSPFAPQQRHTLTLPGGIQWTRADSDSGHIHGMLDGRAFNWSNGRFDFDDIHDLDVSFSQVWVATAGGPFALRNTSQCRLTNPTVGLTNINLSRLGFGNDGNLVAGDATGAAYVLDCQTGAWKPAPVDTATAALGVKQVRYSQGQWSDRRFPLGGNTPIAPLAADGLPDSRLFTNGRFSFDVIRDTTVSDNTLWLATAGGPMRVGANNGWNLESGGLSELDSKAVRVEKVGNNYSLRLAAGSSTFTWNKTAWTAAIRPAPVTDARWITFDRGVWTSQPLLDPASPVITLADSSAALFVSSGKFSFDDVRDVTSGAASNPDSIVLATAGGIVQGKLTVDAAGKASLRISQITARGLCGSPDGVRNEQGRLFVGYDGRRTGQFLGDSCTAMLPWSHPRAMTMPDSSPLTITLSDAGLLGTRGSTPVFQFARTEQILWVFGSWNLLDKAQLIDVIDDGDRAWLVFADNLVVLNKGELQRRGEG